MSKESPGPNLAYITHVGRNNYIYLNQRTVELMGLAQKSPIYVRVFLDRKEIVISPIDIGKLGQSHD